eukprot:3685083-Pleurochrysis_carterae.AAC.1
MTCDVLQQWGHQLEALDNTTVAFSIGTDAHQASNCPIPKGLTQDKGQGRTRSQQLAARVSHSIELSNSQRGTISAHKLDQPAISADYCVWCA